MKTIQPKTITYYNLKEIMETMQQNGFMEKRKFWIDYVCKWGVTNDTIFWLGFDYFIHTDKEDDFKEYFEEVNKLLNLPPDNNGITVSISW